MHNQVAMQIEQLERQCGLAGKRVADVPELANFRIKARRRFYGLAEIGMFLTIFNVVLATAPNNRAWWLSLFALGISAVLMLGAEFRARALTRQLKRRAAEQLWLDMNGLFYE